MMRELGPPLQSAAMTVLWVNGGADVPEGRACKTQSLFYASNPNVAKPREKGLRISMIQAELRSVLTKKRADDADDDSGLPRSPASPPGRPLLGGKTQPGKSGGSCSDGSLLSIYSSGTGTGTDDDIFGPLSEHSSRLSLSRDQDSLELRPAGALSHAAAKHRIAVRPRRNHGASRPRRPGRPGPPPASLPATVEEEGSLPDQTPVVQESAAVGQGLPAAAPERGRATLPATTVAERATPVQRSRSTIADRRLRDLSPRKLWGRDSSEPGVEKKSESFFSRLFGSRRSGRKRKTGGKEAEQPAGGKEVSQDEPASSRAEGPKPEPKPEREPEPEPVLVTPDGERPERRVIDEAMKEKTSEVVAELQRKTLTAAAARDAREASPPPEKEPQLSKEDTVPASPQEDREEEVQQEERGQRSPGASVYPRSLLGSGSRFASQGSDGTEPSDPLPRTPPVQEPQSPESAPDREPPPEATPNQQQELEESPPILRRRRGTPEERPSQTGRVSGGQKLSWMEELRKTPPRDGSTSSGHELRKTFVKEPDTTPPKEEQVQKTPSWSREELRKTPPSPENELRRTWIKEQPKTPPTSEETKTTPPWVKEDLRKSSPPLVTAAEDTPKTPPWVTEELQRASLPAGDPSPTVPLRPSRARPVRRPASSVDPTLPAPAPAGTLPGPSPPIFPVTQPGADPRRRASALMFGAAAPVPPPDSGPRSLDSATLLDTAPRPLDFPGVRAAGRSEPDVQRRPAPAADPAVSLADGERLGAGSGTGTVGSSEGLGDAGEAVEGRQGTEVTEKRQSGESVRRSGSSGLVEEKAEAMVEENDAVENSGARQESLSSSKGSDRSGARRSLLDSQESLSSADGGLSENPTSPEDSSEPSLSSLTPDKPEVPLRPRKVSETEPTPRPADPAPSTPTQEAPRLSPVERTPSSETEDKTPEFMKIHLHRVEAPAAMTTQVVLPKAKPKETPSKPARHVEQKESKAETKLENKIEAKMEDKAEVKDSHRNDRLAGDIPEVVLIEKHSPRQPQCVDQSSKDQTSGNTESSIETPGSPKTAPAVPSRPVLSSSAKTPESSRHASLGRQSIQDSEDSEPVVLRRRPPAPASATDSSPDSELLKVFKRRSLKIVCPDEPLPRLSTPAAPAEDPLRVSTEEREDGRTRTESVPASVSPAEARSVWNQRSVSMPAGGPRSPTARDAGPLSIGPSLTETPSTRPERPDRPRKPAPPTQPRPSAPEATTPDPPRVRSAPSPSLSAAGPSGEPRRQPQTEEEAAPTADWLRLVRQRRERREQREQQTMRKLGHKELIIEPDTLPPARAPAPRSSRVLEMANSFQKLQPT